MSGPGALNDALSGSIGFVNVRAVVARHLVESANTHADVAVVHRTSMPYVLVTRNPNVGRSPTSPTRTE
jgi:hypothetical protein